MISCKLPTARQERATLAFPSFPLPFVGSRLVLILDSVIVIFTGCFNCFILINTYKPTLKMAKKAKGEKRGRSTLNEVVTREYTVNLHKKLHGYTLKKRAPRAVKIIKKFAEKRMGTVDVRIDTRLNKFIWCHGIRNVARRVRVRLSRKRNDDEDSPHKLYTLVTFVNVPSFKGLHTEYVDETE